jgi:hypothetical protein
MDPIFFTSDEFKCKCGCGLDITEKLKNMLTIARGRAAVPFIINSGARCESHNMKEGGSKTSSHLKGLAVDIKSLDSGHRARVIKALIESGFNRLGIATTFIHADIDPGKPDWMMWVYD